MKIGVPKEIKTAEHRVGLSPHNVGELCRHGHEVLVEAGAGAVIDFTDQHYAAMGARIVPDAATLYAGAEMIVKVKEPQASEVAYLTPEHTLFCYLHLAAEPSLTQGLIDSGCTAIAYETVTDEKGRLPLLAPMSEVAGRLSVQVGAHCLEASQGGRGVLLGGVPGVASGHVVVLGGGHVGTNAIRMAMGLEANVTVLDQSLSRLAELDLRFGSRLNCLYASQANILEALSAADLVIGAVLLPGAAAPKLVKSADLKLMKPRSVLVDVSIDQGGCFESSRPTSHDSPTFVEQGIVHYGVTNMPGIVPRTSTLALNNATVPYLLTLANCGVTQAIRESRALQQGVNIWQGQLTQAAVATALDLPARHVADLITA